MRAPLFGPGDAGVGGVVINSGSIAYDGPKGGSVTIPRGSTSVVVKHLLGVTPTAAQLSVQMTDNPTGDPRDVWISGIDATEFTINCRTDPGAWNLGLAWQYAPDD